MVKTYNISEIDKVAADLWDEGKLYKTWTFFASMGAGKTTLIHAICVFLGVEEPISSPTFALINEYSSPIAGTIYHMDWYRLKNDLEAINAGMEDSILSNNYCFIEWPEKAEGILPENFFRISIEPVDEIARKITTSTKPLPKKR